jgi:hypothetical protein
MEQGRSSRIADNHWNSVQAQKHGEPAALRLVIDWFGSGMRYMELSEEGGLQAWLAHLDMIVTAKGWAFSRIGNPIDLIIEAPNRSITRREFFEFQKDFDALNAQHDFRFTGMLRLRPADNQKRLDKNWPLEWYVDGRVLLGDSIGRPLHSRKK